MTSALVLGGGGPVGIAWETGVLAGLAAGGLDLAAERVVGTSAGAVVGAQIAAGRPPAAIYPRRDGSNRGEQQVAPLDLSPLMLLFMRRRPGEVSSSALLRDFGAYALRAATIGEDEFIDAVAQLLQLTGPAWPRGFACTAVDAQTGEFQLWDAGSGVPLARAVASSCAVPGLYPPITIDGRRYIDGGMRSATNADIVSGAARVLALAVTVRPFESVMAEGARRELAALQAEGSRTSLILPDEASLAAFGSNLMDWSRHDSVAAAGLAQGRREVERLGF